jgi:hypothetical protein
MDPKMYTQETASDHAAVKKNEALEAAKEAAHERKEAEKGRLRNLTDTVEQKTGSFFENIGQKIKGKSIQEQEQKHPLQATAGIKGSKVNIEDKAVDYTSENKQD